MTPDRAALLELAGLLDACAEDAKRPHMSAQSWPLSELPDPRIVSVANGLEAIARTIRASITPNKEETGGGR